MPYGRRRAEKLPDMAREPLRRFAELQGRFLKIVDRLRATQNAKEREELLAELQSILVEGQALLDEERGKPGG